MKSVELYRACDQCAEVFVSAKTNMDVWAVCTRCSRGVHFPCSSISVCDDFISQSFLCEECRIWKGEEESRGRGQQGRDRVCGNVVCHKPNSSRWVRRVYQGKLQWLCSACGACLDSGKCCQFCYQIYRQGDADKFDRKDWIGCDICSRWVHAHCDLVMGNGYVANCYDEPSRNPYHCPNCRIKGGGAPLVLNFLPDGKTHKSRNSMKGPKTEASSNTLRESAKGSAVGKRAKKKKVSPNASEDDEFGAGKRAPSLPHRYMYGIAGAELKDITVSAPTATLKKRRGAELTEERDTKKKPLGRPPKKDYNRVSTAIENIYGEEETPDLASEKEIFGRHNVTDSSPYILSMMQQHQRSFGPHTLNQHSPLQTMIMIATAQPEAIMQLSNNNNSTQISTVGELYHFFPDLPHNDFEEDQKFLQLFQVAVHQSSGVEVEIAKATCDNPFITWRSTLSAIDQTSAAVFWLRCSKSRCKKWRKLAPQLKLDEILVQHNSDWCCTNANWDPEHASCLLPEEVLTANDRLFEVSYTDVEMLTNKVRGLFLAARADLFAFVGLPLPSNLLHRPFADLNYPETTGNSVFGSPSSNEVDLYQFYKLVVKFGGFAALSTPQSWMFVFSLMPISALIASFTTPIHSWLQSLYYNALYPMELHYLQRVPLNEIRVKLSLSEFNQIPSGHTPLSAPRSYPHSPFHGAVPFCGGNVLNHSLFSYNHTSPSFAGSYLHGGTMSAPVPLNSISPYISSFQNIVSPSLAAILTRSPSLRACMDCGQTSVANDGSTAKPLLCCAYCSSSVHPRCFTARSSNSELMAMPTGMWVCPRCITANNLEHRVVPLKSLRSIRSALASPLNSPAVPAQQMPSFAMPPALGPGIMSDTAEELKAQIFRGNGPASPSSALELMKSNRKASLSIANKIETLRSGNSQDSGPIPDAGGKSEIPKVAHPSDASTPASLAPIPMQSMQSVPLSEGNSRKNSPFVYNPFAAFPSPFGRQPFAPATQMPSPLLPPLTSSGSVNSKIARTPQFVAPSPRLNPAVMPNGVSAAASILSSIQGANFLISGTLSNVDPASIACTSVSENFVNSNATECVNEK